tara:strand:+ start:403 stop:600 length:198 start_codon:yes stop_codon:yes gene_type:complete
MISPCYVFKTDRLVLQCERDNPAITNAKPKNSIACKGSFNTKFASITPQIGVVIDMAATPEGRYF